MTAVLEQLSSPRILAGTQGDIWVQLSLDGETTTDVTAGATVGVTDEDGNAIVAAGTNAAEPTGTGRLSLALTAAQTANVNKLTATWSNVVLGAAAAVTITSYHEVVGDLLFTLAQARSFDNAKLANKANYPDERILEERDRITDEFGDELGYQLGRRACREIVDGSGDTVLLLGRPFVSSVRSAGYRTSGGVTYTAYTSTELADMFVSHYGWVTRETLGTWPTGTRNLKVVYECGQQPIAAALRKAGLEVLMDRLVPSGISGRALSQTDQTGNYTFATPGLRGSKFGLPSVDVVIDRLRDKLPGIA